MAKLRVYVDAFNVYYGALKYRGPGFRWLDFESLVNRMVPGHTIDRIIYCTARVRDQESANRQDKYIAGLDRHLAGKLEVVAGRYATREKRGKLVDPPPPPHGVLTFATHEEKGSDVNLACRLLIDGFAKLYDEAVVMSNDSDLCAAIRHVNRSLNIPVTMLVNRSRRNARGKVIHSGINRDLQEAARKSIAYDDVDVAACQLPAQIPTQSTPIVMPTGW